MKHHNPFEFEPDMTSVLDCTEDYINSQIESDASDEDAAELLRQGGPLAPYAALIPVAAHQEAEMIHPAMAQYAKQITDTPFSVVAYLNAPVGSDQTMIDASYDELTRAQQDFPDLDIRVLQGQYVAPTIGAVRRDLWEAALRAGITGGTIQHTSDLVGFNHDIDLIHMPRHYIRDMQRHHEQSVRRRLNVAQMNTAAGQPVPLLPGSAYFGPAKHAANPLTPHVNKAAHWHDWTVKSRYSSFEAAVAMPMSFYAKNGGINPASTQSEVLSILPKRPVSVVKTLPLETSNRRLAERLHVGNLNTIWTQNSFHATEAYRLKTKTARDITQDHLHALITPEDVSFAVDRTVKHAIAQAMSNVALDFCSPLRESIAAFHRGEMTRGDHARLDNLHDQKLQSTLRVASFILGRIIRHPKAHKILITAERENSLSPFRE